MRKSEVLGYMRGYCEEYERVYEIIKSNYVTDYATDLCRMRKYFGEEQKKLISDMEIGTCDIATVSDLGPRAEELGLLTRGGTFLLAGRYNIPVRDIAGNLIGLVGYYDDTKKYITTPSVFFSKSALFFNIDHAYRLSWEKYNGLVFLVEGMFDCLSLRAIGLPCIATMGSTVDGCKTEQLKLFRKVIGIPDADKVGRRALNRYDARYGWKVPQSATMLRIVGGELVGEDGLVAHVKDMDNFVSWYDADSVRESLLQFADCKDEIADLLI